MKTYIREKTASEAWYFIKVAKFLKKHCHCFRRLKHSEKKLKVCSYCMYN